MAKWHDPKRNKEDLLEALERSLGIVTPACKEVGISRNTYYTYYNTDEEFRAKVDDIIDVKLDLAEYELLKRIKEGSERSIFFYLKYKGRKRGYVDRQEITNFNIEQPLFPDLNNEDDNEDDDDNED